MVRCDAFPGATCPAKGGWLNQQTEALTGDVPVKLRVPNPDALLRVGMSVRVELNEPAVEGVARDHPFVLLVGLVLSVALMGVASTYVARLLDRLFWLSWVGLGIITFVALRMVWDGSTQLAHSAALAGVGWPS